VRPLSLVLAALFAAAAGIAALGGSVLATNIGNGECATSGHAVGNGGTSTNWGTCPASNPTTAPPATPTPTPTPSPSPTPTSGPTLPPQGIYDSCETVYAISDCKAHNATAQGWGMSLTINFLGFDAHGLKSQGNGNSYQDLLDYDLNTLGGYKESGTLQFALVDGLGGNSLLSHYPTMAADCPVVLGLSPGSKCTTNQQFIHTVAIVAAPYPNFVWYLYDEPGCPFNFGYCAATLGGYPNANEYLNIFAIADYIKTTLADTHEIIGGQVPGGVPASGSCGTGGWHGTCAAAQIQNFFHWGSAYDNELSNATTPNGGYDYYPWGSIHTNQTIDDIGVIEGLVQAQFTADYSSEKMLFVAQAFAWCQEGSNGGSVNPQPTATPAQSDCDAGQAWTCQPDPNCRTFPSAATMQNMRDQFLYYARQNGSNVNYLLWYYYPDIVCHSGYGSPAGCDPTANGNAFKAAATAAFPATPPP